MLLSFTEIIRADVAKLQLQIDKETSKSTNTNAASSTNQSFSDLQQIKVRVDSLESTLDTYGTGLSNIEAVTRVRGEQFRNFTYQTMETITELKVNLTAQGAKVIALNETVYETMGIVSNHSKASSHADMERLLVQLETVLEKRLETIANRNRY